MAKSVAELRPQLLHIFLWLDKLIICATDAERIRSAIRTWSADCVRIREQQKIVSAARERFLNADLIGDLQRGGGGFDATKGGQDWLPVFWHLGLDREDTFERFVPPELHTSAEPALPRILPLGEKHVSLTRTEKLVLLAGVYDAAVAEGAPKFDPWRDDLDSKQHDYWFLVYQIEKQGLDEVELAYVLAAANEVAAEFVTRLTDEGVRQDGTRTVEASSPLAPKAEATEAAADDRLRPSVTIKMPPRPFFEPDQRILIAMSALNANDTETRQSSTQIAEELKPPRTRDAIRDGLVRLREGGYIKSIAHGNQGGYWLTAKGRKKLPNTKAKRKPR